MRDFLNEYGAIAVGLMVGSIAHFGRLFQEGKTLRPIQALGYFMQLGVVGLIAVVITKKIGVSDTDIRALATALLALSTQEVVQWAKRRSWRPFLDSLYDLMKG